MEQKKKIAEDLDPDAMDKVLAKEHRRCNLLRSLREYRNIGCSKTMNATCAIFFFWFFDPGFFSSGIRYLKMVLGNANKVQKTKSIGGTAN